jgi:hypothetical protein
MRKSLRFFVALGLLAAPILVSVESSAQPVDEDPQSDPATSELIQQGIALRRAGKDEAALSVFLEAERQSPNSVRVLLHVTTAAQATGRWLMAHQYLQKAAAFRSDPYYQRYRASIKTIEDTVAQHVGQFRVLGSPAGAEVLLNGEPVGTLPMSSAKVVEVGSYVLEVRKSGFYSLRRPINIPAGGGLAQEAVELKEQEVPAIASRAGGTSLDLQAGSGQTAEPAQTGMKASWVTWTLGSTTLALAATSGAVLYLREREADHWNDDRCLEVTRTRAEVCGDVRDRANTFEKVGVVTGIAAGGFAVATLVHWVWASDGSSSTQEAAAVRASCGAGLGSVLCQGSF